MQSLHDGANIFLKHLATSLLNFYHQVHILQDETSNMREELKSQKILFEQVSEEYEVKLKQEVRELLLFSTQNALFSRNLRHNDVESREKVCHLRLSTTHNPHFIRAANGKRIATAPGEGTGR